MFSVCFLLEWPVSADAATIRDTLAARLEIPPHQINFAAISPIDDFLYFNEGRSDASVLRVETKDGKRATLYLVMADDDLVLHRIANIEGDEALVAKLDGLHLFTLTLPWYSVPFPHELLLADYLNPLLTVGFAQSERSQNMYVKVVAGVWVEFSVFLVGVMLLSYGSLVLAIRVVNVLLDQMKQKWQKRTSLRGAQVNSEAGKDKSP
jgi:hypothetical protein